MRRFRSSRAAGWAAAVVRGAALGLALALLAGCGPKAALISSLLPDGTTSILLSHLEREEEGNRRRIAELEARKDWDGLSKFAEANLAKDPHSANWWLVAGYAHAQAGRKPRAIDCYGEMVRLAPDDLLGWVLLSETYRDAKQPLRVVQTLNNAHLATGGSAETWFMLGETYAGLNRDLPAASAYQESVRMNPEFARAWYGLGRAYSRLNRRADFERALEALQRLSPPLAKELAELRPAAR
jgi:tetratricopeptide (TPR) repeat protein